MSYQAERDQFVARMAREGLPDRVILALLRAATTLQRNAELACSSEAADRDRVDCPAATVYTRHPIKRLIGKPRKPTGACLCDDYPEGLHADGQHGTVTRIAVQDARIEGRIGKLLAEVPRPHASVIAALESRQRTEAEIGQLAYLRAEHDHGWQLETHGDPRGYVLRVIPPSYAARNYGRDQYNREAIGVPARESRIRW